MIRHNGWKRLAASAALALSLTLAAPAAGVLAATGTVIGTQVNVRGDASTSAAIVSTVNSGDTFELGESKEDDTGATWYQITLSDGTTGYIRSDFLNITEDSEEGDSASSESTEGSTEADSTQTTDGTSTPDGQWTIVYSQDDQGEYYYYLYDNVNNERMKLSDVATLRTQVQDAQTEVTNIRNQYRMIMLILCVLLVIMIAVSILLFVRLRDALNGRRNNERDLAQERRNQRRNGEPNPDSLGSIKRSGRTGVDARRNDAYASGARRVAEGTNPAAARDPRTAGRRDAAGRPLTSNVANGTRESGAVRTGRPEMAASVGGGTSMRQNPAQNSGQNLRMAGGNTSSSANGAQAAQNRQPAAGMQNPNVVRNPQNGYPQNGYPQNAQNVQNASVRAGQQPLPQQGTRPIPQSARTGQQRGSVTGQTGSSVQGQPVNAQGQRPVSSEAIPSAAARRPGQQLQRSSDEAAARQNGQGTAQSAGNAADSRSMRRPAQQRPAAARPNSRASYNDDDDDLDYEFISLDDQK